MNRELVQAAEKAAAAWRGTDAYHQAAELIDSLLEELIKAGESAAGCGCCNGDEALIWNDDQNNAFVDSKGEILVTVKDRSMRFYVKCCPNCGRSFPKKKPKDTSREVAP